MSKLLVILNKLKVQASADWLADNQHAAFDSIREALRFPEAVNLCGPLGSGKTFLAWVLSRTLQLPYFPGLVYFDELGQRPMPGAIVDNADASERAVRDLLAAKQRKGTTTLLFLTRRPNEIGFPTVMLPSPTPTDFDVVYHNLSVLEFYALRPVHRGNLWDAIRAAL